MMSYDPLIFVKSLEERLNEFKNILGDRPNLKAYEVQDVWSTLIEMSIEPVGWQALWKVPRDMCNDLKINFPCTAVVWVEQVNFAELSCSVNIKEVHDASLPEKMNDIKLIQLYPTKEQDISLALSKLTETAEVLDSLRFFYNNLWMPWDSDSDEDNFWLESHLEGRLQLYFLNSERKLPYDIAYTVQQMKAKGRRVMKGIEEIQELMILTEMGGEKVEENLSYQLLQLTELHNILNDLRNQFIVYEKPNLLKALIKKKTLEKFQEEKVFESEVYLVLSDTNHDQLVKLGHLAKEKLPNIKQLRVVPSLEEALLKAPAGSTVWLTKGKHCIQNLGVLENGGAIVGVEEDVVIVDEPECCFNLDIIKGSLTMSSMTLRLTTNMDIIRVRSGVDCVLKNVNLEGTLVIDGVDVYSMANFTAVNCHFTNCSTALSCDSNSTVRLINCTFADNNIGLQLKEGVKFRMENCTFSGSKVCGIQISTVTLSGAFDQSIKKHSINVINSTPDMKEAGTTCISNKEDLQFIQSSWDISKHISEV